MPKDGDEIDKPKLRPIWKKAKSDAETMAAKSSADKPAFATLEKTGFKEDLGPDLDKWFSSWPDYKKIAAAKKELDGTIVKYRAAIKDAKLSTAVAKKMTDALDEIGAELDKRLEAASKSIGSDVELGIKESLESHKNKKLTPIVLFYKNNVAAKVLEKAKIANQKLEVDLIEIEVILDDKKVLEQFPDDDGLLAQKMYEAADRDLIISQIAKALDTIAKDVETEKDLPSAQKAFDAAVASAVNDAVDRATAEVVKLAKIRVERTKYKVGIVVKIGALIAGIGASIGGLVTAPFTAGSTAIISIIGLVTAAKTLWDTCHEAAKSAETVANDLASDLTSLLNEYNGKIADAQNGNLVVDLGAGPKRVGVEEIAKAAVNSVWPGALKSISGCKDKSGTLDTKIDGIVINSHDVSEKIQQALDKQATAKQKMEEVRKECEKQDLDKDLIKKVERVVSALEKYEKLVAQNIDQTIALHQRAEMAKRVSGKLQQVLNALAAKQPVWSVFGETLTRLLVSVGFAVGGNVGAPDAFKMLKTVNDAMSGISNGISGAQTLKTLKDDAETALKKAGVLN
jgi:hypothetical protein